MRLKPIFPWIKIDYCTSNKQDKNHEINRGIWMKFFGSISLISPGLFFNLPDCNYIIIPTIKNKKAAYIRTIYL